MSVALGSVLAVLAVGCVEKYRPQSSKGSVEEAQAAGSVEQAGENARSGHGFELDSLAYMAVREGAEDRAKTGVIVHDASVTSDGLSLYAPIGWSHGVKSADPGRPWLQGFLVGMDGKVVRKWSSEAYRGRKRPWSIMRMDENGNVFVLLDRAGLLKLDWDSNLVWKIDSVRFHHDFQMGTAGDIFVITERPARIVHRDKAYHIREDGYTRISAAGEVLERAFFLDAVRNDPAFMETVRRRYDWEKNVLKNGGRGGEPDALDVFHTNTVVPVDPFPGVWEEKGVLVSFRHVAGGRIAVLSRDGKRTLWSWGDEELDMQHDPTLLSNGNILVFDNRPRLQASRVIEMDPRTRRVVWEYEGNEAHPLFSRGRSQTQRLSSGNTFIVSSNQARGFEVSPQSEILWEYRAPWFFQDRRLPIRMTRLDGGVLRAARERLAASP